MFLFLSDNQPDWRLSATQIDIWRFRLEDGSAPITNCLNKHEIERANRFHFPKHQRRFRVARATMRTILGNYLNIEAKDVSFQYTEHGKPFVNASTPLTFNLSHTGDHACLGIGLISPVGIDIERFSERQYMGIARLVFSKIEQQQLKQVPAYLLPMAFFSLWSQKEAVIKCNGLGMHYPLEQLTLPLFSPPGYQFIDIADKQPLQIHRFTPYLGTAASVCCYPNITNIRFFDWDKQSQSKTEGYDRAKYIIKGEEYDKTNISRNRSSQPSHTSPACRP